MKFVFSILAAAGLMLIAMTAAQAAPQRLLKIDDLDQLHNVGDPEISPAGDWVAYAVGIVNKDADKHETHLWMTSFDGKTTVQLTSRPKESESHPRWSPDGRWLAFLSGRTDDKKNAQIWLLDRLGGEAQKISDYKGGVVDFTWSPDGKRVAVVATDEDKDDTSGDDKKKTPKPIVIDRFTFM
jgi:dipeptidyl aminopeptidase/acylaminoacyl peptidase